MSTNVLVATTNAKLFAGISTTDYDQLIEDLNPIVLDDIVNYTKNDFVMSTMYFWDDQVSLSTSTGYYSIMSNDTDVDYTDFVSAGNVIRIADTIQNDGYYSVSSVDSTYILVNESITSESSSTGKFPIIARVIYPKDLQLIASRMIKHLIDSQNRNDVQSESLGDYSYTLSEMAGSNQYPKSVLSGLSKYRKVRFV